MLSCVATLACPVHPHRSVSVSPQGARADGHAGGWRVEGGGFLLLHLRRDPGGVTIKRGDAPR